LTFETFSALGTVGLSMGITAELSVLGKLIIMVLMFLGRLGPLTVALALIEGEREKRIKYPAEEVLIG
jgi:trk system potassium uptake protein TrkH